MYTPKHLTPKRSRKKPILLLTSVVLLLALTITGTLAFLDHSSGNVTNQFTITPVPNEVVEKLEGPVKKDVALKNIGEADAYLRAQVVFTWVDGDGNPYYVAPKAGTDYTATWTMDGWEQGADGYYYYTKPVPKGQQTGILFTDCQLVGAPLEGYKLSVEIVGQAIQAGGLSSSKRPPVEEAWPVTVGADRSLTVQK